LPNRGRRGTGEDRRFLLYLTERDSHMDLTTIFAPTGPRRRRLMAVLLAAWMAAGLIPLQALGAPVWKVYHNRRYGFSFEYPAAWDRNAYKTFCGLRARGREIRLGARTFLYIKEGQDSDLAAQAESFIRKKAEYGFQVESRKEIMVAGVKALALEFGVEGVHRFGAATLFQKGHKTFILDWTGGSASCDLEDQEVREFPGEANVYEHLLTTFKFEKTIVPPLLDTLLEEYKVWLP
jgi:hypothetical protein